MGRRRTPEDVARRRAERAELTDSAPVVDAAATFLAVRPRSVAETRRRLRHLGYPAALVDTVVEQLIGLEYLDDAAFARAWIESRDRARPRGENGLRRELALKGVARAVVDDVLAERAASAGAGGADRAAAEALLRRRQQTLMREQDPRRRRQRAYALLARNGFDPETCRQASAGFGDAEETYEV